MFYYLFAFSFNKSLRTTPLQAGCRKTTTKEMANLLLLRTLVSVASDWVICDVEGVVLGRHGGVQAPLHYEGVRFASHDVDFRYQQAVDVIGDSPANVL